MSESPNFLLDANVFIEARDRYYPWDICPGFWTSLERRHQSGRVSSIDKIKAELVPKKKEEWDDVASWADGLPEPFFKKTESKDVVDKFTELLKWVYSDRRFTSAARAELAESADGWLVSYAACRNMVVTTLESYHPEATNRVLIPNLCVEFGVKYCNTFDRLRELGVKFNVPRRG